jgi:hypothetical protein
VWGLTGLALLVVGLYFGTSYQVPSLQPVNGDGSATNSTKGDGGSGQVEPNNDQDTFLISHLSIFSEDSISISDKINFALLANPINSRGGFVPGIPIERGGGSGSDDSNDDNVDNEEEPPAPNFDALVRVLPDPVPSIGIDVEAFGITNASSASSAIFELFGPNCLLELSNSCAVVASDSAELIPPTFSPLPNDLCETTCEQYTVLFSGEEFKLVGEYQLRVTFLDSDKQVIMTQGSNFRVHSFFVVPESQFGAIALVLSSLATLVIVYISKLRRKKRDLYAF